MAIDATYDDSYFQRRSSQRPRLDLWGRTNGALDRITEKFTQKSEDLGQKIVHGIARSAGLQRKDRELNPLALTSQKAKAPSLLSRILNPFQSISKLEEKEQEKKAPSFFPKATNSVKRLLGLDDSKKKNVSLIAARTEEIKNNKRELEKSAMAQVIFDANNEAVRAGVMSRRDILGYNQRVVSQSVENTLNRAMASKRNVIQNPRKSIANVIGEITSVTARKELPEMELQESRNGKVSLARSEEPLRSPWQTTKAAEHGFDSSMKVDGQQPQKGIRRTLGKIASKFYQSRIPEKGPQEQTLAFSQ